MIDKLKRFFLILGIIIGVFMVPASYGDISISGHMTKAVELACREFEKHKQVNRDKYTTKVTETDSEFVIHFHFKETPTGYRGSLPENPNFTVEVQKHELKVIRSYINR